MAPEVPRELQERDILLAHIVQDANDTEFFAGKSNNTTPRPPELTLQRLRARDRRVEMLLEKFFENVHKKDAEIRPFSAIIKIPSPQLLNADPKARNWGHNHKRILWRLRKPHPVRIINCVTVKGPILHDSAPNPLAIFW